jgi:hypothetical protein
MGNINLFKPFHIIIGFIILIFSEIMMFKGIKPFSTLFYPFAWWSYILIMDGIIYKIKNNSLIMNRRKEFLLLIPWSIFIWLIFELINIYMKNWYYINLPQEKGIRWFGYGISYATVLPGIFLTAEFLDSIGLFKRIRIKRIVVNRSLYILFIFIGVISLIGPIILPKYFFPFIWVSFIFLLEPVNHKFNAKSILKDLENGDLRRIFIFFTSGIICGILWEFWNFWAGSKWVYNIPFFNRWKIFEMPLLGYLGFLPFALECYIMYNSICLLRRNRGWEEDNYLKGRDKPIFIVISLIFISIFSFIVFDLIDKNSTYGLF